MIEVDPSETGFGGPVLRADGVLDRSVRKRASRACRRGGREDAEELFETCSEEMLQRNPVLATMIGDNRYND